LQTQYTQYMSRGNIGLVSIHIENVAQKKKKEKEKLCGNVISWCIKKKLIGRFVIAAEW